MFMLNSSEPIKVAHLQKFGQSINAEWHTKLWSFDKASNALIEKKIEIWAVKNTF